MRILIIITTLLLFGCGWSNNTKQVVETQNRPIEIKIGHKNFECLEWEHNGHKYLIINQKRSDGFAFTHSGECPCNGGTNKGAGGSFVE
jgi:hypothetical protein